MHNAAIAQSQFVVNAWSTNGGAAAVNVYAAEAPAPITAAASLSLSLSAFTSASTLTALAFRAGYATNRSGSTGQLVGFWRKRSLNDD